MAGQIRKPSKIVDITLATAAAAYAANDQIGDDAVEVPLALLEGKSVATLASMAVIDNDGQSDELELLFFDEQPTPTSGDQDAVDITDAEMTSKYLGYAKVVAADYVALAGNSVAIADLSGKKIKLTSDVTSGKPDKSLWVIAVTRGTPTYTANSVKIRLGFDQD